MHDPSVLLLKSYTSRLVKKVGGVEAAANYIGKSPAMISHYCNLESPHMIGIQGAIILTNVTRDTCLFNYIQEQCSGLGENVGSKDFCKIMMKLSKVTKEGADVTQVALEALADQKVNEREVRAITKELIDLQQAVAELLQLISTQGGEEIPQPTESAS